MGFEPMHLSVSGLESDALDHSAIVPFDDQDKRMVIAKYEAGACYKGGVKRINFSWHDLVAGRVCAIN